MPKLYREDEEPLDVSDIRKILLSCNNRRLKVYLLVLASAVEALAVRLKDIDFTISPTKIHIRKEYSKTKTASVFLLGMTLVIYGLRLTVRATVKEISIYFKIMMWGLIAPVIAIIVIYQLQILTGIRLEFVKTNEPFFFISLLLWVPVGIVIFLIMAERRVLAGFHKKP